MKIFKKEINLLLIYYACSLPIFYFISLWRAFFCYKHKHCTKSLKTLILNFVFILFFLFVSFFLFRHLTNWNSYFLINLQRATHIKKTKKKNYLLYFIYISIYIYYISSFLLYFEKKKRKEKSCHSTLILSCLWRFNYKMQCQFLFSFFWK